MGIYQERIFFHCLFAFLNSSFFKWYLVCWESVIVNECLGSYAILKIIISYGVFFEKFIAV